MSLKPWILFTLLASIKAASFTPAFSLIDYEPSPLYLEHEEHGRFDLKNYEVYPGHYLKNLWERQYSIPILLKFLGPESILQNTSFYTPSLLENVPIELICRGHYEIIIPFETKLIEAQAPLEDLSAFMMQARKAFGEAVLLKFIQEQSETFGLLQVTYSLEVGMEAMNYDADDLPITNEEKHELYLMKLAISNLFSFDMDHEVYAWECKGFKSLCQEPEGLSHALHTKDRIEAFIAHHQGTSLRSLWDEVVDKCSDLVQVSSDIAAAFILATKSWRFYLYRYAPVDLFVTHPELFAILPQMLTRAPTEEELNTLMSMLHSMNHREIRNYLDGTLFFGESCLSFFLNRRILFLGGIVVERNGYDVRRLDLRAFNQGLREGLIISPDIAAQYSASVGRAKNLAASLERNRASLSEVIPPVSFDDLACLIRFYPDWDYFPAEIFRLLEIDFKSLGIHGKEALWQMFQVALKFKFPFNYVRGFALALKEHKLLPDIDPSCQELLAQGWTPEQYSEILSHLPDSLCAITIFRALKVPVPINIPLPFDAYLLAVNPVDVSAVPAEAGWLLGQFHNDAKMIVEAVHLTSPDPFLIENLFRESKNLQAMAFDIANLIEKTAFKPTHEFLKMHLLFDILPSAMTDTELAHYLPALYINGQYKHEIEMRGAAHLRQVMENRVMKKQQHLTKMLELMAIFNVTGTLSHIHAATSAEDAQSAALEYFTVSQGFNRKPILELFKVIPKENILAVLKGLGSRLGIKMTSEAVKTAIVSFFEDDLPKYLSREQIAEIVRELQQNTPEFQATLPPQGGQKRGRDDDDQDERPTKKPRVEESQDEDGMQVDTDDS